jgi:hypothetical protein
LLGGEGGLLVNLRMSRRRIVPTMTASVTISHPTAALSLPLPTKIEGITKPIATPIGLAAEPTVVAAVL